MDRNNVAVILSVQFEFNYLLIYVLTQQCEGYFSSNNEQKEEKNK